MLNDLDYVKQALAAVERLIRDCESYGLYQPAPYSEIEEGITGLDWLWTEMQDMKNSVDEVRKCFSSRLAKLALNAGLSGRWDAGALDELAAFTWWIDAQPLITWLEGRRRSLDSLICYLGNSDTVVPTESRVAEMAYRSYEYAVQMMTADGSDPPKTDKQVWGFLQTQGIDDHSDFPDLVGYQVPAFDTWARYLRSGRAFRERQKHQRRSIRGRRRRHGWAPGAKPQEFED